MEGICVRCGQPFQRVRMAIAKYCSGDCRQKTANETFLKRQYELRAKGHAVQEKRKGLHKSKRAALYGEAG